jgi:hypothetical protein
MSFEVELDGMFELMVLLSSGCSIDVGWLFFPAGEKVTMQLSEVREAESIQILFKEPPGVDGIFTLSWEQSVEC